MLRRIQEALFQDKEILASKSLSLEKSQISLATLIMALFYDLATEKDFKIPTQAERRERALRDLIKKRQKPIALFIDDAHDLHSKTLIGLKRLIEVVRERRHAFGGVGWPSEAEERSAAILDGRDRLTRHDIRIGGLGEREEEVCQVVAGTIGCAEDED